MKNLIIYIMMCASVFMLSACDSKDKIFNGKNLDGWGFYLKDDSAKPQDVFFVKDGIINILGQPFGYMFTKNSYENFTLEFEWRYPTKPSNSGLFVFLQEPHGIWPNTVECQLCSGKAGDFVLLGGSNIAEFKAVGERPKFPVVKRSIENVEKPIGEWNKSKIVCKDGTIEVFMNSKKVNFGSKPQFKKGKIALQSEGGLIQFKNLKIEQLK